VQAKQQYKHKYAQLYPHAHDFTFLKAYKTPGFFVRSGRCKSTPWRLTLHSRPRFERQTDLKMLQKEQKKSTRRSNFLQPRLRYRVTGLTVSDVHSDFETETQISRCWCSPCHDYLLVVLRGVINSLYLRLHKAASSGRIMRSRPGLSHERIP
jgi:hypothetical protein